MISNKPAQLADQQRIDRQSCACLGILVMAWCGLVLVFSALAILFVPRWAAQDETRNPTPPRTAPTIVAGSNAAKSDISKYTLTLMEESCPTFPVGTNYDGWVSKSIDPLAPWSRIPVHFKGTQECRMLDSFGGASLIYRYKIEFAEPVEPTSVFVSGVAFNGPNGLLRVLDEDMQIVGSIPTYGGNTFHTFRIDLEGITGRIFYIDEFDTSATWRFRSGIAIK